MNNVEISNLVVDPQHALHVLAQKCAIKRGVYEKIISLIDYIFDYPFTYQQQLTGSIAENKATELGIPQNTVFFFPDYGGFNLFTSGFFYDLEVIAYRACGFTANDVILFNKYMFTDGCIFYTKAENPSTATSFELESTFSYFIEELKAQYTASIAEEAAAVTMLNNVQDPLTYIRSKVKACGQDEDDAYVLYKAEQVEASNSPLQYLNNIAQDYGLQQDTYDVKANLTSVPSEELTGRSPLSFLAIGTIDFSGIWNSINSLASIIGSGVKILFTSIAMGVGAVVDWIDRTFVNPDDITTISSVGDCTVQGISVSQLPISVPDPVKDFIKSRLSLSADNPTGVVTYKVVNKVVYAVFEYVEDWPDPATMTVTYYTAPRILPTSLIKEFFCAIKTSISTPVYANNVFHSDASHTLTVTVPNEVGYSVPSPSISNLQLLMSLVQSYENSGSLSQAGTSEESFLIAICANIALDNWLFHESTFVDLPYSNESSITGTITNYTLSSPFSDNGGDPSFSSGSQAVYDSILADANNSDLNTSVQTSVFYGNAIPTTPSFAIKTDAHNLAIAKYNLLGVVASFATIAVGIGAYKLVKRAKVTSQAKFDALSLAAGNKMASGQKLTKEEIRKLNQANRRKNLWNGSSVASVGILSSMTNDTTATLEDIIRLVSWQ